MAYINSKFPEYGVSPPQFLPWVSGVMEHFYIEQRSKLIKVATVKMVDTPPMGPILDEKDHACSSDFDQLKVVCVPYTIKTITGPYGKPVKYAEGQSKRVDITNLAIKIEYGCNRKVIPNNKKRASKYAPHVNTSYTPMVIKSYRLFYVHPEPTQPTLFMCMDNGEYAVVPGINHKKGQEIACIHTSDEKVIEFNHCMACLTKFCKTCTNDTVYKSCPYCMYEPHGCDSNNIFMKVLRSLDV